MDVFFDVEIYNIKPKPRSDKGLRCKMYDTCTYIYIGTILIVSPPIDKGGIMTAHGGVASSEWRPITDDRLQYQTVSHLRLHIAALLQQYINYPDSRHYPYREWRPSINSRVWTDKRASSSFYICHSWTAAMPPRPRYTGWNEEEARHRNPSKDVGLLKYASLLLYVYSSTMLTII